MRHSLLLCVIALNVAPALSAASFQAYDDAYRERRDFSRFRIALAGYRKLAEANAESVESRWRLAMACSYGGLRVEVDDESIVKTFDEGREAALRALDRDPECVPCHFWRGVNQVLYATRVGVVKMLFSLKEIRAHFKFVADREPGYHAGAALRFLALIDWKLPGLLGGDDDRAREYFESAIQYGPEEAMNLETYYQFLVERGETEKAAALLRRAANLPEPPEEQVESRDAWERMKGQARRSGVSTLASFLPSTP